MDEFIRLAKACSDRNRMLVLKILQAGPRCVCEIQTALNVSQPTASKHLRILEEAGLVTHKKEGLWVEYALSTDNRNPYAATFLKNLTQWFEDDPIWREIREHLSRVNRYEACKMVNRAKKKGK